MSKIEKPWGYEVLHEHNNNYVVKELFMKKGNKCSLQYHKNKHETVIVFSGKLKYYYGTNIDDLKNVILTSKDVVVVPPKLVHRMEAIEDCLYYEASTNQLDDVVRLEDKYGRI